MFQRRREERRTQAPPPPPYTVELPEPEERPRKELPEEFVRRKLRMDLAQKPTVSRSFIRELLGGPHDEVIEVPANVDLKTIYMNQMRLGQRLSTIEKGQDLIIGQLPYCHCKISEEDALAFRSIRQWLNKVDLKSFSVPVGRGRRLTIRIGMVIGIGVAGLKLFWPELILLISLIMG